jgi:hypothetical protein
MGPYPVYPVLGGIPLMARPLIDWLQMGETMRAEGIFLHGGNGQHSGSHRTYWQPYAPFGGQLYFLVLICSHTAGSYCHGTPLPSRDPPSAAHNVQSSDFVFPPSPAFLPVTGSKIQGILIPFRSVEIFWFRNKLQARQTI